MEKKKNRSFKKEIVGVVLTLVAAVVVYMLGEEGINHISDLFPKNTPEQIAAEQPGKEDEGRNADNLLVDGHRFSEVLPGATEEDFKGIVRDYDYAVIEVEGSPVLAVDGPPMGGDYKSYTVKDGDTLWDIAEEAYGDGHKWVDIWEANEDMLTSKDARNASQPGHWIYPEQTLIIPNITN